MRAIKFILLICLFLPACKEDVKNAPAQTACTTIEYAEKAKAVTDSVTALKDSDTEKYKEAVARMQEIADQLRQAPTDLDSACAALDELNTFLQ